MTVAAGARVVGNTRALLGEGPVWDAGRGELVWVDIDSGRVHRYSPASEREAAVDVGTPVSCAVPRAGGGLMLAVRDGFAALAPGGEVPETVAEIEADRSDTRMNDGACDRLGRLWAGTMSLGGDTRLAALYRLDPHLRVTRVLPGVSISNGIGWSPEDEHLYYVDTPRRRIDVFEFDLSAGRIGARSQVIDIAPEHGKPDGLAVDEEGGIWVALFGGGAVHRYDASGRLDERLELPASQVTSCCFGDRDLSTLYVTTAARGLRDEPLAGALFALRPGVRGLPPTPFRG